MAFIAEDNEKTLTDQISDVLVYKADLQKKYTNKTIDTKIENYVKDLGATKDELKALLKSLDGLDFKEDGKIDASVITAKLANNEAETKVAKDEIEKLKEILVKIEKSIKSLETNEVDLNPVYDIINKIKNKINQNESDLTNKISKLKNIVKKQQDQIEALQLDVAKLKARTRFIF